ncbi:MAG: diguanylate cyclase [Thioalkalispiraceae bacterium]
MINWKYYFPFVFLIAGVTIFIHFSWLPNYINAEREDIVEQERMHSSLLAITLVPSLISGDLAQMKATLDQVAGDRSHKLVSLGLFSESGVRLYPVYDEIAISKAGEKIVTAITHEGKHHGKLISVVDVDKIIAEHIQEIYNLEILLISVLVFFVIISIYLQYYWIRRPIQKMMVATTDLAMGNYDISLPEKLDGDLQEYVSSFDKMRKTLKGRAEKITRQQEIQSAVREVQSLFITSGSKSSVSEKILAIVKDITRSEFGFIGEIHYDETRQPCLKVCAITNIAWDVNSRRTFEQVVDEGMIFTNQNTLFGQVMVTGKPVISNEPENDDRSGGVPEGHPVLERFFGIPLYNRQSKLMGMVAVANSNEVYTEKLYEELSVLWLAIGNLMDAQREKILLYENEQNLRAIVNNAIEGIITFDTNGIIETFNPAAEKMFGYKAKEVIGKSLKLLMPSDKLQYHDRFLESILETNKVKVFGVDREVIGQCKDGSTFQMELSITEVETNNKHGFTSIIRDVTERRQKENELLQTREQLHKANQQLEKLVRTDGLTNVANRRKFDETLEEEVNRAIRQQQTISLIIFDIDHFKKYNDYYGHLEGDNCLIKIAAAVTKLFKRSSDLVARYGGEEFAVILPDTDSELAEKMGEVLLDKIRHLGIEHACSGTAPCVTVSVGIACINPDINTQIHDLITTADNALYQAKRQGRNRLHVYRTLQVNPPQLEFSSDRLKLPG